MCQVCIRSLPQIKLMAYEHRKDAVGVREQANVNTHTHTNTHTYTHTEPLVIHRVDGASDKDWTKK